MNANSDFSDGLARCGWVDTSAEYMAYHDTEWGFPQGDDRALFEQLCLEGFQSGLSWRTILNKREAFRRGFAGFDPAKVARFGEAQIQALLADAGIVRHRGKIEAVINNAQRALEMIEREGSLGGVPVALRGPGRGLVHARRIDLGAIRGLVQGAQEAGLEVRGADHRLCVHAVGGHGQRPPSRLPLPRSE